MFRFQICVVLVIWLFSSNALAFERSVVFSSDFESDAQAWVFDKGAELSSSGAHSGTHSARVGTEGSMRTQTPITEAGTIELWVRAFTPQTIYEIKVLTSESPEDDTTWVQVASVEGSSSDAEYHAKRMSIDDTGKKFVRLDIETINGSVDIDDVSVKRISLSTALQKSQQQALESIMSTLRDEQTYQSQLTALKALGDNYVAELEVQRQYLESASGINSTLSHLLATSNRRVMANPLGYTTFINVVKDVKKVSSPIQRVRVDSLINPFGDINPISLNKFSTDKFNAFYEPFKTLVAFAFDPSSYEQADLNRREKKFAERNGLAIYQNADRFLEEIKKELQKTEGLEMELHSLKVDADLYRRDLNKHVKEYLKFVSKNTGAKGFDKVMDKNESIRRDALMAIRQDFTLKAEAVQTPSASNAQLVQFMLKANGNIDELQVYKERLNSLAASMLTFYDKYERSVSQDQNPFSDPQDRKAWEQRAIKERQYIQASKQAFTKSYL